MHISCFRLTNKMKLIRTIQSENKGPSIAILGCTHGNEDYSLKIFKRLKKINLLFGKVDFYLVNQSAYEKKVRYIDTDLNRSFNLTIDNYETKLANKIKTKLKQYDYIIDIHSTTSKTAPFLIYVNEDLEKTNFLNLFNIKKRVFIPNSTFSLISQFEKAVSIEISIINGYGVAIKNGEKYILSFLSNFNLIESKIKPLKIIEKYICVGKINKNNKLKDFKLVNIGGDKFYPMLSGEVKYGELYCFKLKKVY